MWSPYVKNVKSLYKRACRLVEAWYDRRDVVRYELTLLRAKFDANACVVDPEEKKMLVKRGEEELFLKQHWHLRKFVNSPGGVAYEREVQSPDWVLDYWHPLEKMQYPEYFARREQRKIEYVKFWTKMFSPGGDNGGHCDTKPPPKGRITEESTKDKDEDDSCANQKHYY
ncbi:unnamed protein product [Brassicogethes aeneus]|uniref:NADH dehydrogenase [ubiquinone] 1 beta subcomplex subunit 9 n=1 Tax=Brassicogethes aeneus TaxID=1431903 RepID=A0A9P0FIC6_BRAAE|nr:unnamed protein product [Brassicogethes aeneus]